MSWITVIWSLDAGMCLLLMGSRGDRGGIELNNLFFEYLDLACNTSSEYRQRIADLFRHGESEWNKENRFTGWVDVGLSEKGTEEAIEAGRLLKKEGDIFDIAYTSVLKRAIKTLWLALRGDGSDVDPGLQQLALKRAPL